MDPVGRCDRGQIIICPIYKTINPLVNCKGCGKLEGVEASALARSLQLLFFKSRYIQTAVVLSVHKNDCTTGPGFGVGVLAAARTGLMLFGSVSQRDRREKTAKLPTTGTWSAAIPVIPSCDAYEGWDGASASSTRQHGVAFAR